MEMKKALLDTNGYSALLNGDEDILNIISGVDTLYLSVIVLGELYAGFRGGSRESENVRLLELFLNKPTVQVLDVTQETAEIFGSVKESLKQAGTPLSINDVWIASHALEAGAAVVTYNHHFDRIHGVRVVW